MDALVLLLLCSLGHALELYCDSCIFLFKLFREHRGVTKLLKSSWAEVTQNTHCMLFLRVLGATHLLQIGHNPCQQQPSSCSSLGLQMVYQVISELGQGPK